MKQSFATLLAIYALVLTATQAGAQPQIAYIIPDVGAPGLNTYVEIIAPISPHGVFNPSSGAPPALIPPSAAAVELVRPLDSNRLVISPVVASWDGRLLTCQFFVKPGAATGPVPIRVRVDNQTSNVDTFFIVAPQTFGTKNGGGVIGSGGAWGTRSKRGAMIVDSLVLGSGLYTVDISDRDPQTAGEQGYLPTIIISKGPVRINASAVVSTSASGKNAGPGGGGGGGYGSGWAGFPPIPGVPGERNAPLGNGFTGGKSSIPLIPSPANSFGSGTGSDSRSLNGAESSTLFSSSPTSFRLYSAGPGHPFDDDGRSAGAAEATAGSGISAFGTYFGGGGNATKGGGLPAAQDAFNGQVVGNRQIVPLHGGGGGTGGGPNDSVGGGGGGGIAIYSHNVAAVPNVQANGANGANGCNSCGAGSGDASAGGAGGSIVVGGKLGVMLGTTSVQGGRAGQTQPSAPVTSASGSGGIGRFRHDGRVVSGQLSLTAGAAPYTGPTMDTMTVATQPVFTVSGTGWPNPAEPTSIQVYVRGEDTPWNHTAPYTTTVKNDSTWQVEVAITTTDSLFYIFAVQVTTSAERDPSNTDEWTRVPPLVFSQAAANILRYQPAPDLRAPSTHRFDTVLCGDIYYDTIVYRNAGAGELIVDGIDHLTGSQDISIISPVNFPRSIPAGGLDTIIISFDGTWRTIGTQSAQLQIRSNDPEAGKDPWIIDVEVYSAFRQYVAPDPENPPAIDFGDVPVNSSIDRRTVIFNIKDIVSTDMLVDSLWMVPPTPGIVVISRSTPKNTPIKPGDSLEIGVRFSPTSELALTNTFLCARIASPCLDTICWPITGRGILSKVEWSKSSLSMYIPACTTDKTEYDTVTISNSGATSVDVTSIVARPAGIFTVVDPIVPPTQQLDAGQSFDIIVRYTPGTILSTAGELEILTSDPVFDSIILDINGSRDSIGLEVSQRLIAIAGSCADVAVDTVITLRNTGNVEDTVTLSGLAPPFSILNPAASWRIPPGEDTTITIRFSPSAVGSYAGRLLITTAPCNLIDSIEFTGDVANASYAIAQQPLDFAGIPIGSSTQRLAVVENPGPTGIRIISARVVPPNSELRVSVGQNFPIIIAGTVVGNPPETGTISLSYGPTTTTGIPPGTRLEVIIDSPCLDTIWTDIVGRGVRTTLLPLPNPLNFGGVPSCIVATDTIWLYNTSAAPVTVLDLQVDPTPSAFSAALADQSTPTPLVLQGDSIAVVITFDASTPPDGVKTATLKIQTNGPDGGEVTAELRGRRLSESLTIAGPGFGTTFPGGVTVAQQFIVNTGTAPIAITQLNVAAPFNILQTSPPLPHLLAAGDTLFVDIEFAPEREGDFTDSIEVVGLTICGPIKLPLDAISEPSVIAEAYWKDVAGEPGDVILIPLILDTDVTGTATTEYTVDATFNSTMLLPKGIVLTGTLSEGWNLSQPLLDTGKIFFKAISSTPLAGSGTLAFVEATVLLGDDLTTEITSSEQTAFLKGGARIDVTPGTFSLEGYCTVGGNRLVRVTDNFGIKAVIPNPVRGRITVDLELVEDGKTQLKLYDALGRVAATLLSKDMPATPHRIEAEVDLPAGVYFLELETPTQLDQIRVEIQ